MQNMIEKYKYIPPWKIIERECMKQYASQRELATSIGVHFQTLNAVINGRRKLTLEMADKLDAALGFESGFFWVLQAYYEVDQYRRQLVTISTVKGPNVRRSVFWDADFDKIDWFRYKKAVLDRVFSYGNSEEKQEVLRYYGLDHYDYVPENRYVPRNPVKQLEMSKPGGDVKIQFASDLHLEIPANSDYLKHNPIIPVADILVLAGDIGYVGHESYESHPFWDWASDNFQQVIVVSGNHEFYGGYDLANLYDGMPQGSIRKNVRWYYNSVVMIGDLELILTPLFSHISPDAETIVSSRLADFRYIKNNGEKLMVEGYNKLHADCRSFLGKALSRPKSGHRIVVTHHVPSFRCIHPDFKGSILNSAFYNDLDELIENSDIDYWIYGHSHRNVGRVMIGDTAILSNQLGYVQFGEHTSFDPTAVIAIEKPI